MMKNSSSPHKIRDEDDDDDDDAFGM
jgi:hypothetical protein